jgi:hypothetical protein
MDKRRKTKSVQFRLTPEDYKLFDDYAKKHKVSKIELFMKIIKKIKEESK